jgi:hypothetical protein
MGKICPVTSALLSMKYETILHYNPPLPLAERKRIG